MSRIPYILDTMHDMFRDYPLTELVYTTPFQLVVAVVLSAQTTDKQVNKVTSSLFELVRTPSDVVQLWEERFRDMISSIGLYKGKAKNIVRLAEQLLELTAEYEKDRRWGRWDLDDAGDLALEELTYTDSADLYRSWWYIIPDTVAGLMRLAGVGMKTAKVVAYVLYRKRVVAVDTHVHRVMNRLGIISTDSPEKSSLLLEKKIPDNYKDVAHRVIIYFGRYLCTAKRPWCDRCPLLEICPWWQEHLAWSWE